MSTKTKYLKYTPKLGDWVLEQMETNKNLLDICREYNKKLKDGEPTLKHNSIHKWKRDHEAFGKAYDIAYESRLQYLAEYIMDLAHEPAPDTGDYKRDNLELTRRKLIIDSLKFTMATLNGSHFKKHVEVTHNNAPNIVIQSYADFGIPQVNNLVEHKE